MKEVQLAIIGGGPAGLAAAVAARRAGVCGDIQRHHHGQGQRAQSQALRRVAADRDAQRRRAHR